MFAYSMLFTILVSLHRMERMDAAGGRVVQIGEFPAGAPHDITGIVKFTSPTTIVIENFNFDGAPPDTFVYYYAPGQAVNQSGGGTIIPVRGEFATSEGGFRQSEVVRNAELTLDLQGIGNVCDIGTLTLWCRQASIIFTRLVVSRSAFERSGEDPCTLRTSRVILGDFPPGDHSITGTVQFTSPSTLVIDNLSFDGNAPDTFLYSYARGTIPDGVGINGTIIPLQADFTDNEGRFRMSQVVQNENVTIELNGMDVCSIGTITLWCMTASVIFSQVAVPPSSFVNENGCELSVGSSARVVAGLLPPGDHEIGGLVQFTSPTTIFIDDFAFDGMAPDTFLYYYAPGQAVNSSGGGIIIPLPQALEFSSANGAFVENRRVDVTDLTVELPQGTTVCDIGTLTLWCRMARVIFSELPISRSLFLSGSPNCRLNNGVVIAGHLTGAMHGISGAVQIVSPTTLRIQGFNFDGRPPDTFFYSYAPGQSVNSSGGGKFVTLRGNLANAEGGLIPNREYSDADITLELNGTDVCDIGTFTLWCRTASVTFSQLPLSRNLFVNGGEDPCRLAIQSSGAVPPKPTDVFDNCMVLDEALQVSWTVDRNASSVDFQLCGCQGLDPNNPQYMSFGLSGNSQSTSMDNADPVVAWTDNSGQPQAVDYHLSGRFQCRSGRGVCPDEMDSRGCSNDVSNVRGKVSNRQQCVSFTRSFMTGDATCDLPIDPDNQRLFIVWAVGGLGVTAFKHFSRADFNEAPIHLGRAPSNQCEGRNIVCRSCEVFKARQLIAPEDTTFRVQIGPSGNERGYMGITGRPGWGIALFVNGELIPELVVFRKKTYTFIVETGNDDQDLANYHPFYITSSIQGGRIRNSQQERENETVFAGFDNNDNPTGVGHLCQLRENPQARDMRERCGSLTSYLSLLGRPVCSAGEPGVITWTPDEETPDVVYYQCATHLNLGYKITVAGALPALSSPLLSIILSALLFLQIILWH